MIFLNDPNISLLYDSYSIYFRMGYIRIYIYIHIHIYTQNIDQQLAYM